jgi:hypothetical protein
MDSKRAGWLTQKTVIYLSFQIVEQIVVVFFSILVVLNACMVNFGLYDYWKIIAKQCQNILTVKMFILPSHYEVKYPISDIPKFSYLQYAHIRSARLVDSFSNFYFAHDESLKPFFLHQIYRKWIQQCLQTIKLFRMCRKHFLL